MATDNESLVIELQARLDDFEKSFQQASKTANDSFTNMEARGKDAGERMSDSIKEATQQIADSFDSITAPIQKAGSVINAIIGAAVVAGVAGIATSFDDLINKLSDLGDRAENLRLPVNFLQAMSVAADQARLSQKDLNSALDKFTDVSKKDTDGAKDFYQALRNIGPAFETAFKDAASQPARLAIVSNAIASTADEVKKAQLLMEAFGTDSAAAMRVFGQGSGVLDDAREKLRQLGLEIDESAVQRAQEARTQLSLLARVIGDDLSTSLAGLIPTFRNLLPYLEKLAGTARDIMSIFAHSDSEKPTETLKNELSTLDKQLDDLQEKRDRMANNTPSTMDTIRDKLRGILGKNGVGFDLDESVKDVDKQIADVKKRRDQVDEMLRERGKSSTATNSQTPPAFSPRPSLSKDTNDEKTAYDRAADSINRHAAALQADAAAVGLTTSEHEQLKAELSLLQAAQRDDAGVTNEQIDQYAKLRTTMSAQEALTKSGIQLNKDHAETFNEVSTRIAQAAKTSDDAKRSFAGMNDALRFAGDEIISTLDQATQKGANFGQIMQGVLRDLEKQFLEAAITGQGAFGKLFGTASTNGGVGGLLGSLFGGFRAGGGDVSPGQSYIVGERRPEVFVPKVPGTILPSVPAMGGTAFTQANSINIAINGSAGTPQQNQDLVNKLHSAMPQIVQGLVTKEIRRQSRPGGLIANGR